MNRYCYPAIIKEDEDGFSVVFPDLPGCQTCGESLAEALIMAEDALALYISSCKLYGKSFAEPAAIDDRALHNGEILNYIACDTTRYDRRNNSRPVKKTLTIPRWLNEEAVRRNVNFSDVLKRALMTELDIAQA